MSRLGPRLLQALALVVMYGLSLDLALVNLAMTLDGPGWPKLDLTQTGPGTDWPWSQTDFGSEW